MSTTRSHSAKVKSFEGIWVVERRAHAAQSVMIIGTLLGRLIDVLDLRDDYTKAE